MFHYSIPFKLLCYAIKFQYLQHNLPRNVVIHVFTKGRDITCFSKWSLISEEDDVETLKTVFCLISLIILFITHIRKFCSQDTILTMYPVLTSCFYFRFLFLEHLQTSVVTLRYWYSRLSFSPWQTFYIHFVNILHSMPLCFLFKNKYCIDWIFFHWPPTSRYSDWLIHN